MVVKEISEETLVKIQNLPRIDYDAFVELVNQKQVRKLVKFKKPKTIFFDEESKVFLYLNPFHKELNRCGYFYGDEMVTLKELSNALQDAFWDWDINKHIKKLRSLLAVKHRVDFTKDYFMNFNFEIECVETRDYYEGQYYYHCFKRFYDAVIKENTQEEIEELISQVLSERNYGK
jgi:hypothetical protein